MKRLSVLIILIFSQLTFSPALAQTATPTPAPTSTPAPTPELGTYLTVIAPGGSPSDSHAGTLTYTVDAGEVMIAIPLIGLILFQLFSLILRARGHDA